MNNLLSLNDFETVFAPDRCDIRISSRLIAQHFSKEHSTVLRAINNCQCSKEFSRDNFVVAKYKDKQGEYRKEVMLTEKGFNMVVLAFSGKKAAQYREAYINAFTELRTRYTKLLKKEANRQVTYRQKFITETNQAGWNKEKTIKALTPTHELPAPDLLEEIRDTWGLK